ncbi:hypothetical protein [Winogradskyella forsetii]|uniref:hypothetical protein n=1 Tax=Winogradskyella forsetii TaxID=2686077 RepID=UPI0015BAC12D|nr:hypothetical protein [Winogradskyella forsetii]
MKIDYNSEVPTDKEIIQMWNDIQITEINDWSKSMLELKSKFSETHCNGGIQLHKFQISDNSCLQWFASRNRLSEIYFIRRIFSRPELQNYRDDLKIKNDKPKCKESQWFSDIFDLTGIISRMLNQGGAYRNLNAKDAWESALNFVNEQFGNRFDEINRYTYNLEGSEWFYDIVWDYSTLLFDKRNNQIIIIDITDTD